MTMTFQLDPSSGVPIYRQIMDQVRAGVAARRLTPGAQLPTVRALAVELSVNPNTVIKAYTELEREGAVSTEQGTGTFVAAPRPGAGAAALSAADRKARLRALCIEFLARADRYGFTLDETIRALQALQPRTPGDRHDQ